MASRYNPHILFPGNLRVPHLLLPLALFMTWYFPVTESAQTQLRGEVGGKVTFHCPVAKQRTFTFLYFQRGLQFVNGYHASKSIPHVWENTELDDNKTTLHMFNLNVSHIGDYQCHIRYSDEKIDEKEIGHLSITANYSKPSLTVHCSGENPHLSCLVTCASHGGYPSSKMMWNTPLSRMGVVVTSREKNDSLTMLVNSSSTAEFNCSNGELTSLGCSVGDVSSDMFSVCKQPPVVFTRGPYVIAAAIAICILLVVVASALCWKHKKGRRGAAPVTVRQFNGTTAEVRVLNPQTP